MLRSSSSSSTDKHTKRVKSKRKRVRVREGLFPDQLDSILETRALTRFSERANEWVSERCNTQSLRSLFYLSFLSLPRYFFFLFILPFSKRQILRRNIEGGVINADSIKEKVESSVGQKNTPPHTILGYDTTILPCFALLLHLLIVRKSYVASHIKGLPLSTVCT